MVRAWANGSAPTADFALFSIKIRNVTDPPCAGFMPVSAFFRPGPRLSLPAAASSVIRKKTVTMIAEHLPQVREALPVLISLIIIEGLLSVDNMLAIASMAAQLPENRRKTALRLGLAGAYVFRLTALFFVGFIMANVWVKFIGAFYLIHLMAEHFSNYVAEHDDDPATNPTKPRAFWPTVFAIQLMDLSLSVDNVVTAVAMSTEIQVVCLGVCLGLLTLWMFATLSLRLVEKYPVLQHTAFLLIGYVGMILLVEMTAEYAFGTPIHIEPVRKFIGVAAIVAFSIWYSNSETLAKLTAPLLRITGVPVMIYAKISRTLIAGILRPFKAIAAAFTTARRSVRNETD
jgi:YkoY family integral membrane protein